MTDRVIIEVGGRRVDRWLNYTLASDMMVPADGFNMELPLEGTIDERRQLASVFQSGQPIKVSVVIAPGTANERTVLQHTGILETRHIGGARDVHLLSITGRDLAAHLVDSNVPMTSGLDSETSFLDLVREYVAPWGIEVVADPVAARHIVTGQSLTTSAGRLARQRARAAGVPRRRWNQLLLQQAERSRLPIDQIAGGGDAFGERARERAQDDFANNLSQGDIERVRLDEARAQPGESVWGFLSRHASRFGLLMWFAPDGKLIISSPDYGSPSLHRIVRRLEDDPSDRNNVIEGGENRNDADRPSAVIVFGRGGGRNVARSRIRGIAIDDTLPYERRLVVHDRSVRTNEEAERRAQREMAKRSMEAQTLTYTLAGHSDGRHAYAVDTMVEVYDEVALVTGRWYVTSREFRGSRGQGPMTRLKLIPPGAITL